MWQIYVCFLQSDCLVKLFNAHSALLLQICASCEAEVEAETRHVRVDALVPGLEASEVKKNVIKTTNAHMEKIFWPLGTFSHLFKFFIRWGRGIVRQVIIRQLIYKTSHTQDSSYS